MKKTVASTMIEGEKATSLKASQSKYVALRSDSLVRATGENARATPILVEARSKAGTGDAESKHK